MENIPGEMNEEWKLTQSTFREVVKKWMEMGKSMPDDVNLIGDSITMTSIPLQTTLESTMEKMEDSESEDNKLMSEVMDPFLSSSIIDDATDEVTKEVDNSVLGHLDGEEMDFTFTQSRYSSPLVKEVAKGLIDKYPEETESDIEEEEIGRAHV